MGKKLREEEKQETKKGRMKVLVRQDSEVISMLFIKVKCSENYSRH